MRKHALSGLFVLLLLLISFPLFADRAKKVELSTNLLLSSGQHIVYNYGLLLPEKLSLNGFGEQVGVYYNIHERFAIGTHIGLEKFFYSDLMDYQDLKFDCSARIRINRIGNDNLGLFVNCFVGTDFVLREDKATAVYYMHGCGASIDFKINRNMRLNTGCNKAVTFQDGSAVSHLAFYVGISWVKE